jgi:hypothetical protein
MSTLRVAGSGLLANHENHDRRDYWLHLDSSSPQHTPVTYLVAYLFKKAW